MGCSQTYGNMSQPAGKTRQKNQSVGLDREAGGGLLPNTTSAWMAVKSGVWRRPSSTPSPPSPVSKFDPAGEVGVLLVQNQP